MASHFWYFKYLYSSRLRDGFLIFSSLGHVEIRWTLLFHLLCPHQGSHLTLSHWGRFFVLWRPSPVVLSQYLYDYSNLLQEWGQRCVGVKIKTYEHIGFVIVTHAEPLSNRLDQSAPHGCTDSRISKYSLSVGDTCNVQETSEGNLYIYPWSPEGAVGRGRATLGISIFAMTKMGIEPTTRHSRTWPLSWSSSQTQKWNSSGQRQILSSIKKKKNSVPGVDSIQPID